MNIIRAGLTFLLYLFIVVICYFVISGPVEILIDSFTGTHAQVDSRLDLYKTFFSMFFAIWAAVPITWFIFWVMHREPDWSYRGRY